MSGGCGKKRTDSLDRCSVKKIFVLFCFALLGKGSPMPSRLGSPMPNRLAKEIPYVASQQQVNLDVAQNRLYKNTSSALLKPVARQHLHQVCAWGAYLRILCEFSCGKRGAEYIPVYPDGFIGPVCFSADSDEEDDGEGCFELGARLGWHGVENRSLARTSRAFIVQLSRRNCFGQMNLEVCLRIARYLYFV